MSPAEGLNAILGTAGVFGGGSGWTASIGELLDTAKSIATIDVGGRGGEVKVAIDYPTVQVLVLGTSAQGGYTSAYAKAQEVVSALVAIDTPNADYPHLVSVVLRGGINWLGRDEKGRPRFSVNFQLITTPDDDGYRNL